MTTTKNALLALTKRPSVSAIATDTGLTRSTLNRQILEDDLPLPSIVAICRHYDIDLIDMLVALHAITDDEGIGLRRSLTLRDFSDLALAEEIYRRAISEADAESALHAPVTELRERALHANEPEHRQLYAAAHDERPDVSEEDYL